MRSREEPELEAHPVGRVLRSKSSGVVVEEDVEVAADDEVETGWLIIDLEATGSEFSSSTAVGVAVADADPSESYERARRRGMRQK